MILQLWSFLYRCREVCDVSHAMSIMSVIAVVSWGGDVEVVDEEVSVLRVEDGVEVAVLFAHWLVARQASPVIESVPFVDDNFLHWVSVWKFDSPFDFDKSVSEALLCSFQYLQSLESLIILDVTADLCCMGDDDGEFYLP